MKVIRKHPGQMPEVIDIENDGDAIRAELGGFIEAVTVAAAVRSGFTGVPKLFIKSFT